MKRIGILHDSFKVHPALYETVRALAQSGKAELTLLRAPRLESARAPFLLRWLTQLEFKLLGRIYARVRRHTRRLDLAEFTSRAVDLSQSDIEAVRSLDLDLILCDDADAFDARLADAAGDGLLSFQAVEPFWQVYRRADSSAFEIQLRASDSRRVLLRGHVPTRRSFSETLVTLYDTGFPWLARFAVQYAAGEMFPAAEDAARVPVRWPNLAQSVAYAARTAWILLVYFAERKVFKRFKRWGVAFAPGDWDSADRSRGAPIRNLPGRYFADPFLASRDGRTVCFVEDFSFAQKRGRISAIEILDDKNYKFLGAVIEEPFHMSFPYIFEYDRGLYMIPETSAADSIRLYKCREFPMKWDFQKEILRGVRADDSMMFEHEGRWWLLTNIAGADGAELSSQLSAFHAANPLAAEWAPHARNPLVFDSRVARNGGLLRLADGTPVRARQGYAFNRYGARLTLARILQLTPDSYSEEQIRVIEPDFFPGLQGCHHLFSDGLYTVYDFVRTEGLK